MAAPLAACIHSVSQILRSGQQPGSSAFCQHLHHEGCRSWHLAASRAATRHAAPARHMRLVAVASASKLSAADGTGGPTSPRWPRRDRSDSASSIARFSNGPPESASLSPASTPLQQPQQQYSFLAKEDISFSSLGVHPTVCSALSALGFTRPTSVQELGLPPLLQGSNVVLSAETGSGKTLSYLIPVLSKQLAAKDSSEEESAGPQTAIILCPNTALCSQVAQVADSLVHPDTGRPLARAVAVSNDAAPPTGDVDLLIATPNGLLSKLKEWSDIERRWTKDAFPGWIRYVAADEADMLLGGGFIRELNRLLEVFRLNDRYRLSQALSKRFGLEEGEYVNLKYHIRRAGYTDGADGMLAAGFSPPSDSGLSVEEHGFWSRQYMFIAATMPAGGKGSAAADLRKRYRDAVWLNGNQLHMTTSGLSLAWQHVTEETKKDVLRKAISESSVNGSDPHRILVFVNSVAAAVGVATLLEGIEANGADEPLTVLQYHRDVSSADRKDVVQRMKTEGNAVMVCTDSAARGLDIPGITHVIQAEFATSAVDFLHRAGRTARAGAPGQLTSLYSDATALLAVAIRQSIENNIPVEKAFSRKRSFRKKVRKYGEEYAMQQGVPMMSSGEAVTRRAARG